MKVEKASSSLLDITEKEGRTSTYHETDKTKRDNVSTMNALSATVK